MGGCLKAVQTGLTGYGGKITDGWHGTEIRQQHYSGAAWQWDLQSQEDNGKAAGSEEHCDVLLRELEISFAARTAAGRGSLFDFWLRNLLPLH